MATETTRWSSYAQFEGYKDSAGTLFNYANAALNSAISDVSGLTGSSTAVYFNQVFSGLAASVVASQINNIFSGLASTVTAGMITGYALRAATADAATTALAAASATTAARATTADATPSASYAASAGTVSGVSALATEINTLLYGTKYKYYAYSVTATNDVVASTVTAMGISTALFAFITPAAASTIVGAIATQTGIQYKVTTDLGTATNAACSVLVIGNA